MNKKISIFLLGVVILANSVEGARKRQATKRGPQRKNIVRNIVRATTPTKSTQPVETQEETYVKIQEPEAKETSSEPTESIEEMQQKIATLTAQNTVLNNEIKEKQTRFNDLTKKLSDIEEKFSNLETQQNKSKSTCRNILPKKIDEIKGWLIGAVSASGVGTLAHATATTTSFLQKSEEQFNKKYERDQLKNQNKFATIGGGNQPSAGGGCATISAGGCSSLEVRPAKIEPAKVEPAKIEPAKVEPAKIEPAKVEASSTITSYNKLDADTSSFGGGCATISAGGYSSLEVRPAKVEPAKVEPAKIEPAKVEASSAITPYNKLDADTSSFGGGCATISAGGCSSFEVRPAKVEPAKIEPAKVEASSTITSYNKLDADTSSFGGGCATISAGGYSSLEVRPAKVEPAKVEPAKIEPAKVEASSAITPYNKLDADTSSFGGGCATISAGGCSSFEVRPAKVEPAKIEPAKVEPAKIETTTGNITQPIFTNTLPTPSNFGGGSSSAGGGSAIKSDNKKTTAKNKNATKKNQTNETSCETVVNNWCNTRGTQMTVDEIVSHRQDILTYCGPTHRTQSATQLAMTLVRQGIKIDANEPRIYGMCNTNTSKLEGKWTIYKRVFVYAFENPNPLFKSDRDEKWAKQQKTNNILETVSNVSTIVGTVASAGSAISSGVATALINTIAQQVKDCKGSF